MSKSATLDTKKRPVRVTINGKEIAVEVTETEEGYIYHFSPDATSHLKNGDVLVITSTETF